MGSLDRFEHAHAHGTHAGHSDDATHDHGDAEVVISAQYDRPEWDAPDFASKFKPQSLHDGAHEHPSNMTPLLARPIILVGSARVLRSWFGRDRNNLTGTIATTLDRPPKNI